MKRTFLIQHLLSNNCRLKQESERHTWWTDSSGDRHACIPRQSDIADILAARICASLGVEF